MKAVLLSIKPKYCELIASGEKTIEIRKTQPTLCVPFKVYIYQTLPKYGDWNEQDGRIIGEFICDYISKLPPIEDIVYCSEYKKACLSVDTIKEYAKGKQLYGWHISNLKIYDKPKELSDFGVLCPEFSKDSPICEGCRYENTLYNGLEPPEFDCKCDGFKPLTRPPQSWCYVDELVCNYDAWN